MTDASAGLTAFADGVWLATTPVRILGMRLTATMAVLVWMMLLATSAASVAFLLSRRT